MTSLDAMGANDSFRPSSFARTKRSTGEAIWPSCLTFGKAGRFTGWKAQYDRSADENDFNSAAIVVLNKQSQISDARNSK